MVQSFKFWRLITTSTGFGSGEGSSVVITRLEFLDANGINLCVGGVASASDEDPPDIAASMAFDDDPESYWMNPSIILPQWIQYEFSSPAPVCSMVLSYPSGFLFMPAAPSSFEVQASADGVTFVSIAQFVDDRPFIDGESRSYIVQIADQRKVMVCAKIGPDYVLRQCRVYRHDTGMLVGQGQLAVDGSFTDISTGTYYGLCYVVVFDDDTPPSRNALIHSRVIPVLAS